MGKKARFWFDSWDGHQSINKIFNHQDWMKDAEIVYGEYVVDYVRESYPGSGSFEWIQIQIDNMAINDQRKLIEILQNKRIAIIKEEDEVIWCVARFREYTARLDY